MTQQATSSALLTLALAGFALPALARTEPRVSPQPQEEPQEEPRGVHGAPLTPEERGPEIIETWDAVQERSARDTTVNNRRERGDAQGEWVVPKPRATFVAHSGEHYITNKWGDTRMGIGFPEPADVAGAWISGQADEGVWPARLRVSGQAAGEPVSTTEWFEPTGEPQWLAMDFEGVDRILFEVEARVNGAAWFALDDLTFSRARGETTQTTVLGFDDLGWGVKLTGSGYGGLDWEIGTGSFDALPAPGSTIDSEEPEEGQAGDEEALPGPLGPGATAPTIELDFKTVERGQNFQFGFPPDTNGAIGPDHFVCTVNSNFAVYNKATGGQLQSSSLGNFQPGTSGDPRVLYDHHANRWIVVSTNFTNRIYFAYSLTSNPTGAWFKTNFTASTGSDAGCQPDFPTVGVDENGIYISAQMFSNCGATLWVIDKAPLLSGPSLGSVTAFRNLPFEILQPCLTYGSPGVEYILSRQSASALRLRTVTPPMNNPTLTQVGAYAVPIHSNPPNASALGSNTNLDTGDARIQNAVYRDGRIYAAHTINASARAACRWYELNTTLPLSAVQTGTISDPSLHYFFPSISSNHRGDVLLGFSGSNSTTSPSCYLSGRVDSDPPGSTSAPILYKAGSGSNYNLIDNLGRNRWGDYSLTTVDPSDDYTFWTIQEYVKGNNDWGTWVARANSTSDQIPIVYCTPKISSAFCINLIGTTNPSAQPVSGAQDYSVTCLDVQGFKNGLVFAGILGPGNQPFNGGTLCVQPPTKRGPIMNAGGSSPIACDGTFATLINDGLMIPFGLDAGPGNSGWYQYWYRDPGNGTGNDGTALSNAVQLDFQ